MKLGKKNTHLDKSSPDHPSGAKRFIALTHPTTREESVARHRKWQARLKKEDFFNEMRELYKKAGKK